MSRSFAQKWPSLGLRTGVLPFRSTADLGLEFLLVRRVIRRFWSVPKGHIMPGRSLAESALVEAHEEAGISGIISPVAVGSYLHFQTKISLGARPKVVEVVLFPLEVDHASSHWPEMQLRERRWFQQDQAVRSVAPGQLREILAAFVPAEVLQTQ